MKRKIETYSKITNTVDIKIEPFDVNKRYTKPHRHNKYLELVYFRKGSGAHFMDHKSYDIKPPIIFLVNKDEVHHWSIDTVPDGYVMIIKEDFLDRTMDKTINLQLQQLSFRTMINLQQDETINSLFQILCFEIKDNRLGQNELVEGILKALLSKIIGYANIKCTSNIGDTLSRLEALLGKELRNDVFHYATLLNTTSQNLTSLCKARYSKTTSQVIALQIIREAKRLCRFTDLSVSEIAFKFHFKDVSHFVKYFKRHVGVTPLQFKKSQ